MIEKTKHIKSLFVDDIKRLRIIYKNTIKVRNNIYDMLDKEYGRTGYKVVRCGPYPEHVEKNMGLMKVDIILKTKEF